MLGRIARVGTNAVRGVGRLARGNFSDGLRDVAPAAAALAIPGVGGAIGGLASSALGAIPGAGAVGGMLSSIPGAGAIGSIGSRAAGALGGLGENVMQGLGGLAQDPVQLAMLPFLLDEMKQGKQDRERARGLADDAMGLGQQSAQWAMDRDQQLAPMREEFMQGAMGFHDPTNPFSQSFGHAPMAQGAPNPMQQPTPQMPGGMIRDRGLMAQVQPQQGA